MAADPDLNIQSNGTTTGTQATLPPAKLAFSLSSKPSKPTTSSNAFPLPKQVHPVGSRTSSPGTKRPYSSLLDEDASSTHQADAVTTISTFGADTSSKRKEDVEPERVIQGLANKDWREEAKRKRQKSSIPGQGQGQNGSGGNTDVVNQEAPAYGLTIAPRASVQEGGDGTNLAQVDETNAATKAPQSADEEALAALLGAQDNKNQTTIRPASPGPVDEDEAFANDFRGAPRMATLDEYTATPVEGFGAAILRGYLKPGETLESRTGLGANNKKPEPGARRAIDGKAAKGPLERRRDENGAPVRRAGLLGLGAKNDAGAGIELGAWGKNARGKGAGSGARTEIAYMPVAMRNKKTGEVVSEEELKKLMEEQKFVEAAGELGRVSGERDSGRRRLLENGASERDSERDSRRDNDDEERRRSRRKEHERRRRDDSRDYDSNRGSRRDKSRERDSRKDEKPRRYHDDDDYDRRERRRDKSRERDDNRSDRRKDDDRHRSRRDKERDKDRSSRRDGSRDRGDRDDYHRPSRHH